MVKIRVCCKILSVSLLGTWRQLQSRGRPGVQELLELEVSHPALQLCSGVFLEASSMPAAQVPAEARPLKAGAALCYARPTASTRAANSKLQCCHKSSSGSPAPSTHVACNQMRCVCIRSCLSSCTSLSPTRMRTSQQKSRCLFHCWHHCCHSNSASSSSCSSHHHCCHPCFCSSSFSSSCSSSPPCASSPCSCSSC